MWHYTNKRWSDGWRGSSDNFTYRTRLTRAELRTARGLEPEPCRHTLVIVLENTPAYCQQCRQEMRISGDGQTWEPLPPDPAPATDAEDRAWIEQEWERNAGCATIYRRAQKTALAAIARERARKVSEETVMELVNAIGESETCLRCNGGGTFLDTTYDRTGIETACGHCDGAGVTFSFNPKALAKALSGIRAASEQQQGK